VAPELTPPQTIGPFFHGSLLARARTSIAPADGSGAQITIEGRVLDGLGAGVPDAMVEVWQSDPDGRFRGPGDDRSPAAAGSFLGFGRSGTDHDGRYGFETVRPGSVPGPGGSWQAPHLDVLLFARGLLDRLATRIYFEDDDPEATDAFLAMVPAGRRTTLIARREDDAGRYRHDLVLQGDAETVFFDA
jgi:protocatechuate 3,4-dioxygenase alpha subunit